MVVWKFHLVQERLLVSGSALWEPVQLGATSQSGGESRPAGQILRFFNKCLRMEQKVSRTKSSHRFTYGLTKPSQVPRPSCVEGRENEGHIKLVNKTSWVFVANIFHWKWTSKLSFCLILVSKDGSWSRNMMSIMDKAHFCLGQRWCPPWISRFIRRCC